jgi:hypothetical protein
MTTLAVAIHQHQAQTFLSSSFGTWFFIALLMIIVLNFAIFLGPASTILLCYWFSDRLYGTWNVQASIGVESAIVFLSAFAILFAAIPVDWARRLCALKSEDHDDESTSLLTIN